MIIGERPKRSTSPYNEIVIAMSAPCVRYGPTRSSHVVAEAAGSARSAMTLASGAWR